MSKLKSIITILILNYLRLLARIQLAKNPHINIIGITGSSGKTSTRVALGLILSDKGKVKECWGNSESGIPLNILGLSPKNYTPQDWLRLLLLAPFMLLINWERYDYLIAEMGIDSPYPPKNMAYLLRIIRPDLAIILNAGLAHAGSFDHLVKDRDPERRLAKIRGEIAKEKMGLATAVDPSGVVILNSDQAELSRLADQISARVIKFGRRQGAGLKFSKPKLGMRGFSLELSYQGRTHTLTLPDLYDESYAYTFAAAVGAAVALGISLTTSLQRLTSYRSAPGRLRLFPGTRDSTVIDSSYNASPNTMHNSLKLLSKIGSAQHRLAIVGDMRELGKNSKYAHKSLADWLIKYSDEAILFGDQTLSHTLPVLKSQRFPVRHFKSMRDLTDYLQKHLTSSSFILVKGSQNQIFLERAVESLLANEIDAKFLCRRGGYWDKLRANTP